jgi:hypothetical protein
LAYVRLCSLTRSKCPSPGLGGCLTTDGAFIRAEKYHRIDRNERPVLPFPLKILSLKPSNRARRHAPASRSHPRRSCAAHCRRSRARGRRRMYDAFARQMVRQRRPLALEAFLPRIFSAAAAAAASCACVSVCEKARELKLELFEGWHRARRMASPQPDVAKVRVGMGHAAQAVLVRGAPA